ncbi:ran GTPase-activating protein 1 [Periplaneta americana]|uniref:ran GTPase-activating protein 1 n=1 Tax=Periplaneta americana TaxID=6978 RepID=UPI0037E97562
MSDPAMDEVTKQLSITSVGSSGVSFEGKSLKLNTEDDARDVIKAVNACQNLHYLNLEGNTLGVDAAKAIGKALEAHSELKRALWKDLFTGRMKTEIPKALHFLSSGLVLAGTQLLELDLSDNAFGPIGVEGLAMLLRSPSCHLLQILKLNNNGLGISGGKMLSRALLDCYNNSRESGKTLALKVFIAGRNRLENEGAKALAEVFRTLGTLEEVCMPQNGIYHVGITALSEAFVQNPNLRVLNLNDNTITAKGAVALANAFPKLQKLQEINLGDCLLKTKGALLLAAALADEHNDLQKLHLGFNEIGARGGLELSRAMRNKEKLVLLDLGGNQFGETGRQELQSELQDSGRLGALGSLSEDEDEDEEEGEDEEEEDDEEDEDEEEEDGDDEVDGSEESETEGKSLEKGDGNIVDFEKTIQQIQSVKLSDSEETKLQSDVVTSSVTVTEFLQSPTQENFTALGSNRVELMLKEIRGNNEDTFLEKMMPILMKVSSLSASSKEQVKQESVSCSDALYRELFKWAEKQEQSSIVNNSLLVHLGLIKSEDKKLKLAWNLDGCMFALEHAIRQDYFPKGTRETLQIFLNRPNLNMDVFPATKHKLMSTLFQF